LFKKNIILPYPEIHPGEPIPLGFQLAQGVSFSILYPEIGKNADFPGRVVQEEKNRTQATLLPVEDAGMRKGS